MQRWIPFFMFLLWGMVACGVENTLPTAMLTASPTASPTTLSATSAEVAVLSPTPQITPITTDTRSPTLTPTTTLAQPVATETPTATFTATSTRTHLPTYTPFPTPIRTATPTSFPTATSVPLAALQKATNFPDEPIRGLDTLSDGRLLVYTVYAVYLQQEGGWQKFGDQSPTYFIGQDNEGYLWFMLEQPRVLGRLNPHDGSWTRYDESTGWVNSNDVVEYLNGYHGGILNDRQNGAWLAASVDGLLYLNRETQQWRNRLAETGFPTPIENNARLLVTAADLDSFGNVWVAACAARIRIEAADAVSFVNGYGVRWFDGSAWQTTSETDGLCIRDLQVDGLGRVWLMGEDDAHHGEVVLYDPANGRWQHFTFPEPLAEFADRPRYPTQMWLDPQNQPWFLLQRINGASIGPAGLFTIVNEEMVTAVPVVDPNAESIGDGEHFIPFTFTPDGRVWSIFPTDNQPFLWQETASGWQALALPQTEAPFLDLASDGNGRLWLSTYDALYSYQP